MQKFLHIRSDGGLWEDPDGQNFHDLNSAIDEARSVARELIASELRTGRPLPYRWAVQIMNDEGAIEAEIAFEDVLLSNTAGSKTALELFLHHDAWWRAQEKAFDAVLSGAPTDTALAHLADGVIAWLGEGASAAFYLANSDVGTLHHVVGLSPTFAEFVDVFRIGADSLASGLITHGDRPLLTTTVRTVPLWAPWIAMAEEYGYSSCWSLPIRSKRTKGSFAIYSRRLLEATKLDLEFAQMVTLSAAVVLDGYGAARENRYFS
jgi:hypothetical protein